jgi:hypothetical protein
MARLHLYATLPSLGALVAPNVEAVIFKALSKDPTDRYPSILKFAEALEEATTGNGDRQKTENTSGKPENRTSVAPAIAVVLVTVLVLISILAANLARPVASVSNTHTTSPSPQLSNPYTHGGNLVLNDPLNDNNKGYNWLTGTNERGATCEFGEGAYHTTQPAHGFFHACDARNTDFSNFIFEVDMTLVAGDYAGVLFRKASNDKYYIFHLATDGAYDLRLYSQSGSEGQSLVKGSTSINLYQENLIAVVANQNTITMYVNHQLIRSVNDNALIHGRIAVLVGNNTVELAEARFRNAKVWAI